ncbi:hypothetical protein Tsubulata_032689, partial [Turnera subulata]
MVCAVESSMHGLIPGGSRCVMDSDNLVPIDVLKTAHQNGVHAEGHASEGYGMLSDNMNWTSEQTTTSDELSGKLEDSLKLDESASVGEEGESSNPHVESNGSTFHKEGEEKYTEHSEQSKSQKGPGKGRNIKPSNSKSISVSQVKKVRDGKDVAPVSNGSVGLSSRSKQPLKSKSFNERSAVASK